MMSCVVFFFKQKTAYEMRISDWSSDVCSSDLEHADDVGRLVADDGPAQPVPQHRHGDATGVVGFRLAVDLVQLLRAVHAVGNDAGAVLEGPALLAHVPVHHREGDRKSTRLNSSH